MFVIVPERSSFAQRTCCAARFDFRPDGGTNRLEKYLGLVVSKLVDLPSKQIPQSGDDIAEEEVHYVVRHELGAESPEVVQRRLPSPVCRARAKNSKDRLKPSFRADERTAVIILPDALASSIIAALAEMLSAV